MLNDIKELINHKISSQVYQEIVNSMNVEEIKSMIENGKAFLDTVPLLILLGDKDYIKECIKNKKELELFSSELITLISFIGERDYTIECIKKRKELELNSNDTTTLILSLQDKEFTKQCINNYARLGLESDDVIILTESTDDIEYIKQCIETDIIHYSFDKLQLIRYINDKEYMKKCVNNWRKLYFSDYIICELIKEINEDEFTKKCIDNSQELGIDSDSVIGLIHKINNIEYVKQCIENYKQIGISTENIYELVRDMHDVDYIKQCINRRKKFGFDSEETTILIRSISDKEYVKECIKRNKELKIYPDYIVELIEYVEDKQYIKECIQNWKEFELKSENIESLIRHLNENEYTKKCIEDIENLNLDAYSKAKLVIDLKDEDYAKKCIEKYKELKLSSEAMYLIIDNIYDHVYKKECIERRKELNLEPIEVLQILIDTNHTQKEVESILNEIISKNNKRSSTHTNIPEDMTIGVEIEVEGKLSNLINKIVSAIQKDWETDRDSSLNNGTEIKSPILKENKKITTEIKKVCSILNGLGETTSERCGAHIHVGAKYLKSEQSLRNLAEIWSNTEKILYTISNKEGEIPRDGIIDYAVPISRDIEEALGAGAEILDDDVEEFLKDVQNNKYYSINFLNIGDRRKNTIEFRMPNGTIDSDIWIQNINLFGGIISASEELSNVQKKKELTAKEQKMLYNFEKIKSSESQEEKLEALLELAIQKEDREIYRKRYYSNKNLIEKDENIGGIINRNTAKKPISLNKIGKKVFTGKDAITGSEYFNASRLIEKDLQRQINDLER